jgi:hypothetical protein
MTIHGRIRQFYDMLRPDTLTPPALPDDVRALLTDQMVSRFRALAVGDQRHLLAVYGELRIAGADDDTCVAGLLHDVGKADGSCRVRTMDRVINVLLRRYCPEWRERLAQRRTPPRLLRGLHLAVVHAEIGATLVALHGYNPRISWLIRHHERCDIAHDDQLALLIAADDAADSSSTYYT